MAALGPFEPAPRIAAGVSGGADSMAWRCWPTPGRGSAADRCWRWSSIMVCARSRAGRRRRRWRGLAARGIAAKVLTIEGLRAVPALAERARAARFAALEAACAAAGILHLLLGHHAGDQAETLLIRALGGSGPAGLAGMAPLVETTRLRLLRPLLAVAPARLRATLVVGRRGMDRGPVERRYDGAAAASAPAAARP